MTLRVDIATALRDATRRADPYELEFLLYIKECLCRYDRRPKKKRVTTGHSLEYLEFAEHIVTKIKEGCT